jgi:hypothetical protein
LSELRYRRIVPAGEICGVIGRLVVFREPAGF